jgi:hypothetical protein
VNDPEPPHPCTLEGIASLQVFTVHAGPLPPNRPPCTLESVASLQVFTLTAAPVGPDTPLEPRLGRPARRLDPPG